MTRALLLAAVAVVAGAAGIALGIRRERRAVARILADDAQEFLDSRTGA
ncbi:MAG TPA: hypothetical protein VFJ85_17330 [Acidimicrobiales bacterium]|nr:hypothetical protein [Acidimicrobiales bacterium]